MKEERIQKLVSNYSSYSRREFERMIKEGKVKVNGQPAELGMKATVNDSITVEGKRIKFNTKYEYYLLNKPKGYICERYDKMGRPVISLIPRSEHRNMFPVGRLDVNTTGLLIITNDGELAETVTRPSSNKKKVYIAWLTKEVTMKDLMQLKRGVKLDDGYMTKPLKQIRFIGSTNKVVKLTLTEGKKNQVKRMFEAVGSKVWALKRDSIEALTLDGIDVGSYKRISQTEIYNKLGIEKKGK